MNICSEKLKNNKYKSNNINKEIKNISIKWKTGKLKTLQTT